MDAEAPSPMGAAYAKAKASKPRVRISVYTESFARDDKYEKERRARRKSELKALQAEMKKFDRDKAADKVYAQLMREEMRLKNDLEMDEVEED